MNEKWIKASIIGTIWAASEIVLGSFLHNLRVPFSGNILTAIGLIILISISYTWTEKGLFWRAGLICAILKTMSPSAVIFGPMIAIFTESLLLETSVRLLGRTIPGYLLGATLAMSWNLFQKIANYIIFYGSNIVEVYVDLLKLAQRQLNLQTEITWLPIFFLLIIYASFGLFAGIIGIRVGRKMLKHHGSELPGKPDKPVLAKVENAKNGFKYSLLWLFINIFLMIGSFLLLNFALWVIWSLTIAGIVTVWSFRYRRAFRQLLKPGFWLLFVFITLITAFVFTKAQTGENVLLKGLLTGLQMNFRAVVVITGFSVLGTELYNPKIRNFFLKTSVKHLPLALELSAESLPSFIASIPDLKSIVKNPVSIFHKVIMHADKRLTEIRNKTKFSQKVFIISGSVGEGKTTFIKNMLEIFKTNNISVGGILSQRVMINSQTTGYDIVDIENEDKEILLRHAEDDEKERIGIYSIYNKGFEFGTRVLQRCKEDEKKIIIIDEVGKLELGNKGWANLINELADNSKSHLLIAVRDSLVEEVIQKWQFKECQIYKISETDFLTACKSIIKQINS